MTTVKFKWFLYLEALIPEHHVARVMDEIVEATPDKQLFSHYKAGAKNAVNGRNL